MNDPVDELDTLFQLRHRYAGDGWTLTVVDACNELSTWIGDHRKFDAMHIGGWQSAIDDFRYSHSTAGSRLRAVIRPEATYAIQQLAKIENLFSVLRDRSKKNRSHRAYAETTTWPQFRADARTAIAALSGRLRHSDIRAACWDDLCDAAGDPNSSPYAVAAHHDDLRTLIGHAGRNPRDFFRRARDILNDNAWSVKLARQHLGVEVTVEPVDLKGTAELSLNERINLCRDLLVIDPTKGQNVVWLATRGINPGDIPRQNNLFAIDRNMLVEYHKDPQMRSRLGGTFPELNHDHPAVLTAAATKDPSTFTGVTLIRIDLGDGVYHDAPKNASEEITRFLTIMSMVGGHRNWELLSGHVHYIDEANVGLVMYMDTTQQCRHLASSSNVDWSKFNGLLQRYASEVPHCDPHLEQLANDVGDLRRSQQQQTDPRVRVATAVRAIERTCTLVGYADGKYFKYLADVQVIPVIRDHIGSILRQIAHSCLVKEQQQPIELRSPMRRLHAQLDPAATNPKPDTPVADLLALLPHFQAAFPDASRLGRRLRYYTFLMNDQAARIAFINEQTKRVELAFKRAQRIRNSATHGGPGDIAPAERLIPLLENTAERVLRISIQAIVGGNQLQSFHTGYKVIADDWRDGFLKTSTGGHLHGTSGSTWTLPG